MVINVQPPTPTSPISEPITQPTCTLPTGTIVLNGLPATGTWILTRTPGGIATSGTGENTIISGLKSGIYTYTVTNSSECISATSDIIVIEDAKTGVVPRIKMKWDDVLICYNLGDSIKSFQWYQGEIFNTADTLQYFKTGKKSAIYKVETIDLDGCKNFSNAISTSGTKSLSVYPNPASVNFALKLNEVSESRGVVTILTSAGIKVMEFEVENMNDELLKEIPVNNLDEGIYIVQVLLDNKNLFYTKIIVIK